MKKKILILLGLAVLLFSPTLVLSDCTDLGRSTSVYVQDDQTIVYYMQNTPVAQIVLQSCTVNTSSNIRLLKGYVCEGDRLIIDGQECVRTLSNSNRSGRRWTSSMTTNPESSSRALRGASNRRTSTRMLSGMDDPQMGKVQTLQGLVHRFGYFRGLTEFAFNPIPAAMKNEEKINLSTAMGGPEKCLGWFNDLQNLFDGKAFPRSSYPGIAVKGLKIGKVKQSVENTRIPQVYLGCFYLALAGILIPRLP